MARTLLSSVLVVSALAQVGCTRTQLSRDPGGSQPTGIRFYDPKPYLLLTRRSDTGKREVVKSEVLTLPDTSRPRWIADPQTPGSYGFTVEVEGGLLKSLSLEAKDNGLDALSSTATQLSAVVGALRDAEAKRIEFDAKYPKTPPPAATTDPSADATMKALGADTAEKFWGEIRVARTLTREQAEVLRARVGVLRTALGAGATLKDAAAVRDTTVPAAAFDGADTEPAALWTTVTQLSGDVADLATRTDARRGGGNLAAPPEEERKRRDVEARLATLVVRLDARDTWDFVTTTLDTVAEAVWVKDADARKALVEKIAEARRRIVPLAFSTDGPTSKRAALADAILVRADALIAATPAPDPAAGPCPACPAPSPKFTDGETPVFLELYEIELKPAGGYTLRLVKEAELLAVLDALKPHGIVNSSAPAPKPPK